MKRTTLRLLAMLMVVALLSGGMVACSKGNEETDDTESSALTEGTEDNMNENEEPKPGGENQEPEKEEEEEDDLPEKSIDLYLIAGQSNASGTSKITDRAAAYAWAPSLENGFTNIHYAGNSRSTTEHRDLDWQKVTLGLGIRNQDYVGPEAGMAKALSAYYNEESGKDAGFIKYAMGGSALLNKNAENWASPSYVATLDESEIYRGKTGVLYANFLAQVEKNVSELVTYGGYTKINICGLYWMQGCNDRSKPTEYQPAFVAFAADIRRDLSALMQEYTGTTEDCGASEMPIVVGTISQTQNLSSSTAEATNRAFIEMQKGLPSVVENCYVVDNSQFAISGYNSADPSSPIVYGSDRWHWNQADALKIGENVGKLFLTLLPREEIPQKGLTVAEGGTLPQIDVSDFDLWK